ncbi:MAG: glycosyltransferase family 4 protein [Chitinispirillaceae bacterium]|jgi:glycosyltransferase involved in cell wall biosynthesis|nr:glycosyltransferase family 4 protein [Chitinispirillaceae bacterium]
MRIALVNSEYPSGQGHGGIATYTYTMANALAARGDKVHLFVRAGTLTDHLAESITVHPFNYKPPRFFLRILSRIFGRVLGSRAIEWEKGQCRSIRNQLLALHRQEGLDVVEFPEYGGLAGECRNFPFPVVINFHTPSEMVDSLNSSPATPERKRFYRHELRALKNASAFRSPSEAMKTHACARYNLAPDKITVIRNPIATGIFDKIGTRYPRDTDAIQILFVGRLEFRKGIETIARNIKKILALDPRIVVTFAGESEIRSGADYRVRIENSLLDEERKRVWFLGAVNRSDLAVLYCRSSIFLIPSIFENAPYALLEAMAAKLPVIGADSGGIGEIIRHGENGLLFPKENPDGIVRCIGDLIDDQFLACSCAEQAAMDLRTIFSADKIAAESITFYNSLKTDSHT